MLKYILMAKSLPNSLLLTSGPDMSPNCLQKYQETQKFAANRLRDNIQPPGLVIETISFVFTIEVKYVQNKTTTDDDSKRDFRILFLGMSGKS